MKIKKHNYGLLIGTNSHTIWNFFEKEEIAPKYQEKCKSYNEKLNFLAELTKHPDMEIAKQYVQLRLREKILLQVHSEIISGNYQKNLLELIIEVIDSKFEKALKELEAEMISDVVDAKHGHENLIQIEIKEYFKNI